MQVTKRHVDIVLPPGLKESSASLLALCELFVGRLLEVSVGVVDIRVDLPSKSISCSDERLRETTRLFLGAGKIEGFVTQLLSLLHPAPGRDLLGILICHEDGKVRQFAFQRRGEEYVDWRITSSG